MRRRAVVLVLAVLALAGSACGSDNKVGDESLLNFKEQAGNRLGETTTTTAAATTTTAAAGKATTTTAKPGAKAGVGATTTTANASPASSAPVQATTTRPAQTAQEIHIYGDNDPAGHLALEPPTQTAYVGSIIRWINKDKVPRSVRADSGQFASPMIAPGASWDYIARTAGEFDYSDDTRPYVTGKLLVAHR